MSGQNKPNAIAALVSLNANGQLEKWKNESKTLRPVIKYIKILTIAHAGKCNRISIIIWIKN